ncbi:MAG TPA: hypothetical protein DEH78_09290 [Solibacterales bacterium]|nr:hypothetical protein [Bryobacterales bacterium]
MRHAFAAAVFAFAALPAHAQMVGTAILTGTTATGAAKSGRSAASSVRKTMGRTAGMLGAAASIGEYVPRPVEPPPSVAVTVAPKPQVARLAAKLTKSELETVEIGITREALLARYGAPRSRVTVFEEGKLDESFRYSTTGGDARVRLIDGKVAAIEWQ